MITTEKEYLEAKKVEEAFNTVLLALEEQDSQITHEPAFRPGALQLINSLRSEHYRRVMEISAYQHEKKAKADDRKRSAVLQHPKRTRKV
jgi:hypothetical protein